MANQEVLAVDLGQSGSRIKQGALVITSDRGKLVGESPLASLRAIFESTQKLSADVVSLSCTGFNGVVTNPESFAALCAEYFGATKVAVIDDGLAGYVGALNGRNGVVLSIGGGVVAVGGNNGKFAHRDGLGSTFGDEGGGFWLGKAAITKALAANQGRHDDPELATYFHDEIDAYYKLFVCDGAEAQTFAINTAKKVLEAADKVHERRTQKIATSKLNDVMLDIFKDTPPPSIKGKYIKIKYCTQLPTHSPKFAFFANLPQYIKEPYRRFAENKLRAHFDLTGVPIEIFFRKK